MRIQTPRANAATEGEQENLTATDNSELVEEIVTQLTGEDEAGARVQIDLRDQMQKAAEEFDTKTANVFARALLGSLCDDPGDVRMLEALLILGLAHPTILDKHRISLVAEGRRLAVLLERAGDVERARSLLDVLANEAPNDKGVQHDLAALMRRTGKTDALIERYLRRAEEAIGSKKPMQAIPWLQEVLLHDSSRRDIARMIRDLRMQDSERKLRNRRRFRFVLLLLLLSTVITGVAAREKLLHDRYDEIAEVQASDLRAMSTRLAKVDQLIDDNKLWLGMFQVVNDRNRLRQAIDRLESEDATRRRRDMDATVQQDALAELARTNGLTHARRGEFAEALEDFRTALTLGAPDWEQRQKIARDIAALEEWQKGNR